MNEITKFYQSFLQEVETRQRANEEGDTQEQTFTRIVVDMLAEAGETENVDIAYDEKGLGTKNQHKINAYAISDNYETIDLFISIYAPHREITTTPKLEIDRATTRITNFFRKAIYNDYANEVAESSRIFEFANTLGNYQELRTNLIRINAFIITSGEYKGDIPTPIEISGYKIYYQIIDINYLFKISEQSRVPIEINFEEENFKIPCLSSNSNNNDYEAYIAIVPGVCLSNLYDRYGSRLLEQNVRSFLQFTGKINKGIRDTIKNEPHMFFAFNNGIAATADHIELSDDGRYIKKIKNLQIVNGGQTTASIFHTAKKDKADISNIYVQIKFSIIKREEEFGDIVARISRYANTQNKVNDADFTANNPNLVAFEKLSRYIMTPINSKNNLQTYWFFERARGQYKNLRQKEGFTKSRQNVFDLKYPKSQLFTKVELAKYINSYREVYEGKKLVIGPHIVVRGNEKNYAKYINNNLPDNIKKINNVYFEDTIAKAILFRTADKRYGTKKNLYCIGEMKQVVVPYTISLLNILTNDKLNLYKIWKEQQLSEELSDSIYELMKQVNKFIIEKSPISHYIEWAKKEECWNMVKENIWAFDIADIQDDLYDENNMPKRNESLETEDEQKKIEHELGIIQSIPPALWKKIADWGQGTQFISLAYQTSARDVAHKLKFKHKFTALERDRAIKIYEIVCKHNIELLEEADELMEQENNNTASQQTSKVSTSDMTLELVQRMVEWDKKKRVLEDWKWKAMDDVAQGRKPFTDRMKYAFYLNLERLKKIGFDG